MKDQVLSIEQMQKLKELGIDTSSANMVLLYYDEDDNILDWNVIVEECDEFSEKYQTFAIIYEEHIKVYPSLLCAETGSYDHSYRDDCGVFTLQDMIELMPNKIRIEYENYYLCIDKDCTIYLTSEEEMLWFEQNNGVLINTYNMLVWLAENKYI